MECKLLHCDRRVGAKGARGLCPRHYGYWLRTGTPTKRCATCDRPVDRAVYCDDDCKPRCEVEGCIEPVRKTGWCASHYAQQQKTGQLPTPFAYKWAERVPCKVCGSEGPRDLQSREFCSARCRAMYQAYDGNVPSEAACVACGVSIDLTVRGKGGQRRKASVKFCRRCRQDYAKYKLSARELAERDGTNCGICGDPVDMDLRRSESNMCASVDHITPRSRGGTHEPENLQLAHLLCNQVKSDRQGFSALVEGVI